MKKIFIVDYGLGNIHSAQQSIKKAIEEENQFNNNKILCVGLSVIDLSIGKSFKKGGAIKKAYLGSYIAGGPDNRSNSTYRKYYKGMI